MATAQAVLDICEEEVGYDESSGNRSKYGAWYGLDAQPWCAMFISWAFYRAGMPLPASTSKGFAYTPSGAEWFQKKKRWGQEPKVGAVVFFRFPGSSRINHVGIVKSIDKLGILTTIEGNTNAAGSRTGGSVLIKQRRFFIAGYGYPEYDIPAAKPQPKEENDEDDMIAGYDKSPEDVARATIRELCDFHWGKGVMTAADQQYLVTLWKDGGREKMMTSLLDHSKNKA